jgi:hypothetical protein
VKNIAVNQRFTSPRSNDEEKSFITFTLEISGQR